MSIRYTLRTLKESDVNLDNLKRHELCLTDTGKVMIRLHNDTIVDLSGAAAQYAVAIANTILTRGQALSDQIDEWSELDNQAIQVFNDIYDDIQDDAHAVEVALGEVRSVSESAYQYTVAAQTAASNASTYANNAKSYRNTALQYKNDTLEIKQQTQGILQQTQQELSSAQGYVNQARNYARSASDYADNAEESAEMAAEKEEILSEILTAHANVKKITNANIDDIWDGTYVSQGTGQEVDPDGIYCLPIPIPKIKAIFQGEDD